MKVIDIILPVYDEEEGVAVFHEALTSVLTGLSHRYDFRVIYVLDRCRDNSLVVLKGIASRDGRVTVIHLSRRFGHQMSLIAGLDHSNGDASILMDCDVQHPPELIAKLLEKMEQGYDIAQAIRIYDSQIHAVKQWSSHIFYKVQNWLSPIEIPDGAADFRLITRKVRDVFRTSIREQNQFLRGLFQWVGFHQATVEFVSPPRAAGVTKYGFLKLLTFSIAGITSFSKMPLRAAAILGFVISALSALYGLFAIGAYLTAGHLPPGYTSLIVAVSFMGGLQLTVLGIVGEYLGAVFDEVKRRPLYIVDQVIGRTAQIGVRSHLRLAERTKEYMRTKDQRGVARRFRSGYQRHPRKGIALYRLPVHSSGAAPKK